MGSLHRETCVLSRMDMSKKSGVPVGSEVAQISMIMSLLDPLKFSITSSLPASRRLPFAYDDDAWASVDCVTVTWFFRSEVSLLMPTALLYCTNKSPI